MTRDEILAMEPGRELDALVGKAFGYEPRFQWWAMDREEKGVFISFEWRPDADAWFEEQNTRFPQWVESNGCHLVKMEIHRNFSESISAAWEVVEELNGKFSFNIKRLGDYFYQDPDYGWQALFTSREVLMVTANTAPEAICKAALLAVLQDTVSTESA